MDQDREPRIAEDDDRQAAPRRALGGPGLRFSLLVLLGAISVGLLLFSPLREFFDIEHAYRTFKEFGEKPWAPAIALLLYLILGSMGAPLMVLMVAAGALFGAGLGTLLNYVGVLISSSSSYWLGRTLGRDLVESLLGSRRVALERLIDKRGFWSILRLRFVPVPFPVTNYGAALLGVPWRQFLGGTAIAYIFIAPVWSYFAHALTSVADGERSIIVRNLSVALVLMALLTFLPQWLMSRYRRSKESQPDVRVGR